MSHQLVAVIGRGVLDADEPLAYADDLGLTRGDGCFDATLVFAAGDGPRRVLHLDRHLDRLDASAAGLHLDGPAQGQWRSLLQEALAHPSVPESESMLKLVLERGREEHGGGYLAYLTITALPASSFAARSGIEVVTLARGQATDAFVDAPWLLGGIKTISYAVNMAAKREAASRGADDVLFVASDGYALEAPTAALITRFGDELVTTPTGPTGVLASITIATTFEAAAADGVRTSHRLVRPEEILGADGAWLVSSVRGVTPIRHLDGTELAYDAQWHARLTRLAGFEGATT